MANRKITRHDRSCAICGASSITGYKYCSKACQTKALVVARKKQRRALWVASAKPVACAYCRKEFLPAHGQTRRRWCSDKCRQRHRSRAAGKAVRVSHWVPPTFVEIRMRDCEACGSRFSDVAPFAGLAACGDCRRKYPDHQLRSIAAKDLECSCARCGAWFCHMLGRIGRRLSGLCPPCAEMHRTDAEARARRATQAIRRKRIRGNLREVFDPFEVFERDGWRCRKCKCATPKRLRGTINLNAPELDHIVPVAAGGEHSRRNTQLLCRKCNMEKSDRADCDQLLLFG